MSLVETLNQDMKSALRAGDKLRLSALRMALAAIKKQEIDARKPLDDAQIIDVLGKLIKQGRDAQSQYESAGRGELADKEAAEIAVFEAYMPKALSEAEIETLIAKAIADAGASDVKDMGRVMGLIKAGAQGRVDMGKVSGRVREVLSTK